MSNPLRWIFWFVCMVLRVVLIIIGVILPIHMGYNTPRTKGLNLGQRYYENCIRNPTPYLRGVFKQPIPEVMPNPDEMVREDGKGTATRVMVSGPYIEYWKLERRDSQDDVPPYWEFRIGWKFVDGDDTFWPTIQFGPRR